MERQERLLLLYSNKHENRKMNQKREELLKQLKKREHLVQEFYKKHRGSGLKEEAKKLLRYRHKYFIYIISHIRPFSIQTEAFWNKNLWISLPKQLGIYLFGSLSKEIELGKFIIRNVGENSVFYDVGAHCGFYSTLLSEISGKIEVHSFEPVPKIYDLLHKNLSQKNNVFLNCTACLDKGKEVDFYEDLQRGGRSSYSSAYLTAEKNHPPFRKITVNSTTLDNYCLTHRPPNMIKIDAEGSELLLISGGKRVFNEASPTIAIEICHEKENDKNHSHAIELLYSMGYKSYRINREGYLKHIKKLNPKKDIPPEKIWEIFIFQK